ncbi:sigma-70 family RNA polymerase sigma factor [Parasphingorhabdus sp.]|uniref:sigma-70 family RNA polymerase sigma factor n=1 Tax=Parasphingorhabdus sp. TaxID=2709688 RepID=UPI003001121A
MTRTDREAETAHGLEAVLLDNREKLIRFLAARGAGDSAEDVFQELWFHIAGSPTGPVAHPLSYLFRAANNLMLDRHRSARAAETREQAWGENDLGRVQPSVERSLISREELARADAVISAQGERAAASFRYFRIEGMNQRDIAARLGVSLSTVEADLRKVYRALAALGGQADE